MPQNPSSKFFWNDWQQEPGLRVCCLAARGLWMEALCVMARARPAGYLRIGNRPCTASDLAAIAGASEETVDALLEELRRNEVFSTTRDGTIYSRRMVRECSLSAKRAKAGRLGGVAKALADKAKSDLLRQVPRQNPSKRLAPLSLVKESVTTVGANSPPPEPETSNVASGKPKRPRSRSEYPPWFETLWDEFPKRGTDTKALAYKAVLKVAKEATETELIDGCRRYAAYAGTTGCETMLVSTWCSRKGWTASYQINGKNGSNGNGNGHGKHENWYGRRILERATRRAAEAEVEPCPGLFELESRAPIR